MNNKKKKQEPDPIFGEVIYSYTRAQAIEDGVLVDVTDMAKEAGDGRAAHRTQTSSSV
jgi:type I site-specific restriction endonuclease